MSDKGSFKFILFFVALQFLALSKDAYAVKKSDFAFVVSCGQESSQRLCLMGKFKAKIKVTLIPSPSGPKKICTATTSRREKLETADGYLSATGLAGSCKIPEGNGIGIPYDIGILKKPVNDYERLPLKEVANTETVSNVTQLVMSSKALSAFREERKDFGSISAELGRITPKVYQFPIHRLHVLIASFENANENGPRFVVINDRVYPLTGWCSYDTLNIFRLEGQYYISSGSSCCGCGITVMELFRVTPKGPVTVLSDSSFSD